MTPDPTTKPSGTATALALAAGIAGLLGACILVALVVLQAGKLS